jgi:hypothetical protein
VRGVDVEFSSLCLSRVCLLRSLLNGLWLCCGGEMPTDQSDRQRAEHFCFHNHFPVEFSGFKT